MKKPLSFTEGAGIALLLSIIGSILFSAIASLFGGGLVLRILISLLGLSYIAYLIVRSPVKTGRISTVALWSVLMTLNLAIVDSLLLFISLHILVIWLVRSLYFYNSVFSSLGDLLLGAISLAFAISAWHMSHSLLLALWSFFLCQALFVFIPAQLARRQRKATSSQNNDGFERAYDSAQQALHKLYSSH